MTTTTIPEILKTAESKMGKSVEALKAERWQIISPVRGAEHGVDVVNRIVQQTFRKTWLGRAASYRGRKIHRPLVALPGAMKRWISCISSPRQLASQGSPWTSGLRPLQAVHAPPPTAVTPS